MNRQRHTLARTVNLVDSSILDIYGRYEVYDIIEIVFLSFSSQDEPDVTL